MDEGRSRVANGQFLLLLICVLMLFLPVRYAYGDTYDGGGGGSHNIGGDSSETVSDSSGPWGEFWYGPNSFDSEGVKRWKTGVVAYTYWDAALYALGYTQSTIDGISPAKKVKLMDSSTGGYFYTFAKSFQVGRPTEDAGNPILGWNPSSMLTAWYAAKAMYGETYCYWQVYSDTMKQHARDSANTIIKGGSESGGGSGSGSGSTDPEAPKDTTVSQDGKYVLIPIESWKPNATKSFDCIALNVDTYNGLLAYSKEHNYVMVGIVASKEYAARVFCVAKDNYEWLDGSYGISFDSAFSTKGRGGSRENKTIDGKRCTYLNADGIQDFNFDAGVQGYYMSNIWYRTMVPEIDTGGGGEGDDEPDPPEWPKPPADPPVPVLPPPGDPVTPTDPPDPTPPDPIVDPGTDPWVPWTPETDGGTGTDIQAILDAMNRHCIHLQDAIEYNVEQLYELQRTYLTDNFSAVRDAINDNFSALLDYLKDAFDWLGNDVIIASFTDLKDYLHQLFEWLSETLNVSTESYDDTSVLYWLKQIWGKMGGGISVKPVDPSIDNDGWWDWFANLLGGLIGALADIGLDKIGGLVDALDTLKDKFPFCIPWDIAALLGLLVSEPVTPVVQVPLMALSVSDGVQQVGTMTIDLTPYDGVWDAVRWIERIAFCVYLATRTKDFLDLLGKIKG